MQTYSKISITIYTITNSEQNSSNIGIDRTTWFWCLGPGPRASALLFLYFHSCSNVARKFIILIIFVVHVRALGIIT